MVVTRKAQDSYIIIMKPSHSRYIQYKKLILKKDKLKKKEVKMNS